MSVSGTEASLYALDLFANDTTLLRIPCQPRVNIAINYNVNSDLPASCGKVPD